MRRTHDWDDPSLHHDLQEAEILSDRIGILDRGRLIALAPADELKEQYKADTLEDAFFSATGRSFRRKTRMRERGVFA